MALTRRRATEADVPAILSLVERTMRGYVEASLGRWDAELARGSILASLADGSWEVLTLDGAPLGVMAVSDGPDDVWLDELFLEPGFQGRGWGTRLIREVLTAAHARGRPVRLRVLRSNPAQRLYARLGFVVEQASAERLWMVAPAGGVTPPAPPSGGAGRPAG